MSDDRAVINAALMHVSSFRWRWGPCTLLTGRPRGRILRGLWHIQERPTLQRTFQDPSPGSVGHPGLYFLFSQFNLSVKGSAVTLHVLVNSQQVFSWMFCRNFLRDIYLCNTHLCNILCEVIERVFSTCFVHIKSSLFVIAMYHLYCRSGLFYFVRFCHNSEFDTHKRHALFIMWWSVVCLFSVLFISLDYILNRMLLFFTI